MLTCLAIVCTVGFSVNGPIHNVHFCVCMLPQTCAHVVFTTVSEDFTVFHILASQCSVCVQCPVTVALSQNRTPANCWLIMWCGLCVTWD